MEPIIVDTLRGGPKEFVECYVATEDGRFRFDPERHPDMIAKSAKHAEELAALDDKIAELEKECAELRERTATTPFQYRSAMHSARKA